jgi:kynureninase
VEGVRLLLDVGLEAVRAHSLRLTKRALARADEIGVRVQSPRAAERRGAMVILDVSAADRLCAFLKTQHIYTDSRKGRYLRMAPFVWNTAEEVDRTFETIEAALRDGTYRAMPADAETAAGPVT